LFFLYNELHIVENIDEKTKGAIMKKLLLLSSLPFLIVSLSAQEIDFTVAPDFHLIDIDGNIVYLDSLLETGPLFMSFWALWCTMCIKELDALKPYYEALDSLGVNFLAISVDKMRSVPQIKPFARSKKWQYTILLDPENMLRDMYNVQAMPTSFIIDRDKKIVFIHQGYKPGDEEIITSKLYDLITKEHEDESEE
jgi:cytochrome c biogenesis protein CcmG/thiol:disulfide interchange protein DsbE